MSDRKRLHYSIQGTVQGVGFRPFVYRLARQRGLTGWVSNTPSGAELEVEGDGDLLLDFEDRLEADKPEHCFYAGLERVELPLAGSEEFFIRKSHSEGPRRALVLPDLATCKQCLREIFDARDRRFRYPFTNCTQCGPRYSIIESIPYDRANTTMHAFGMCPRCLAEYTDPRDRRFHAQPLACPECGPRLSLWDALGSVLSEDEDALQEAARYLRDGRIVAVKGLGGFQLLVDARQHDAVRRLRARKRREEKPFAIMAGSMEAVRRLCCVDHVEEALLLSSAAPIVLLEAKANSVIAPAVAPGNPYLGVMLPYTPLHHLLLDALGFPVVATSGNLGEEPILIDEGDALLRLGRISDAFLVHNRPIARPVDDSVVRILAGKPLMLRRARGYAPLPIYVSQMLPPVLATGGQLKNTVALAEGREVYLSQHIGDLSNASSFERFRTTVEDITWLHQIQPERVVCDRHPDYTSTQFAVKTGLPLDGVQHHHAHILSVMAEHDVRQPVLGVSWDGTGYGEDGSIWGGEFLLVNGSEFRRIGSLRPFPLPGGEQAIREPRRSAWGLLYALRGAYGLDAPAPIVQMLEKNLNCPLTSSAGRLFDAVAALLDLAVRSSFEGQAAMQLEFAIRPDPAGARYPFPLTGETLDWAPLIEALLEDRRLAVDAGVIARRFHQSLVEGIMTVARHAAIPRVALGGGCFQNKWLAEHAIARLTDEGFEVFWPQKVPPNDGGLALGQIWSTRHSQ